ncbi:MAG: hypothetical protein ACRD29_18835 [Acidimicrobiales bacterium]
MIQIPPPDPVHIRDAAAMWSRAADDLSRASALLLGEPADVVSSGAWSSTSAEAFSTSVVYLARRLAIAADDHRAATGALLGLAAVIDGARERHHLGEALYFGGDEAGAQAHFNEALTMLADAALVTEAAIAEATESARSIIAETWIGDGGVISVAGLPAAARDHLGALVRFAQEQEQTREPDEEPIDLNGDGFLSPREVELLAWTYAPILYLHPAEQHVLEDPLAFIEHAELIRHDGGVGPLDASIAAEGEIDPTQLVGLDSNVFLDVNDGFHAGDNRRSRLIYQYDRDTNSITYHIFYAYNDGPSQDGSLGDAQNHEGDWEKITINLDDTFQPVSAAYSAHGGESARPWAEVTTEEGRPVVFVGAGSHANFFEPGAYPTGHLGVDDHAAAGGERVHLAGTTAGSAALHQEPYAPTEVRWGEWGDAERLAVIPIDAVQDAAGSTSGPVGPQPPSEPDPTATADTTPEPQPPLDPQPRPVPTPERPETEEAAD